MTKFNDVKTLKKDVTKDMLDFMDNANYNENDKKIHKSNIKRYKKVIHDIVQRTMIDRNDS